MFLIHLITSFVVAADLTIRIVLDENYGRLKLDNSSDFQTTVAVTEDPELCLSFQASLTYLPEAVFRPIHLEMHYSLTDVIPDAVGLFFDDLLFKNQLQFSFATLTQTSVNIAWSSIRHIPARSRLMWSTERAASPTDAWLT